MPRAHPLSVTVMATLLALSLIAAVAGPGVGLAGAVHPSDAPDLSEHADFRVEFPNPSDHHTGSTNPEGGSIQYFASGADAFDQQGAEEGVFIDWIIVHAEYEGEEWIDYSACSTENTESFGIDRGNNNEGTEYDEGLVQKQKRVDFRDDGIVINFYNWEDLGGDPPYMAPEDAIVASQGEGSAGGPCLTLTDSPGWYRIAAFLNGTVADNGPDSQPSEDAGEVGFELNSNNYLYVCDCEDEAEAREQLGPPPNEEGSGSDSTPTPTDSGGDDPTSTESGGDGGATATPAGTETGDAAGDDGGDGDGGDTQATDDGPGDDTNDSGGDTQATDGGTGAEGDDGPGDSGTPTPGDGPGFGPLAAVLALLATALLANRRR